MADRTQIALALALWMIVGAAAFVVYESLPAEVAGYQDFKPYHGGALALRRGVDPYGGDFAAVFAKLGDPMGKLSAWERAEPQLDTPAWLLFFEPFTFLEPPDAYRAWAAFNLLCLGAALLILIRELGPSGAPGWTVAAAMLLYPPIAINFWFAQSEIVLLLIFVLALAAVRRQHHGVAGAILAAAALLRAYPLGMFGYLVARRAWRACGYFIGTSILGCAAVVASAGFAPAASFVRVAAGALLTHSSGVPAGLLKHPANLNLGAFVHLVAGDRGWASAAALAIELAAAAFVAAAAPGDDRYGCGFALWLVVITMLSPVAWPQFLVCLVPLYVGIAAARYEKRLPRRVLNLAGASYLAALLMGGPLGFLARGLARTSAPHLHFSYFLPAEAAFVSLVCAYFAAYFAAHFESSSAAASTCSQEQRGGRSDLAPSRIRPRSVGR